MTEVYVIYYLFEVLSSVLAWVFGLCLIFPLIAGCAWLVNFLDGDLEEMETSEERVAQLYRKVMARGKKLVVVSLVALALGIFVPDGKEVLTLYAMNEIDIYNQSKEKTMLTPQSTLMIIDKTMTKVDSFLDGIGDLGKSCGEGK